MPELEETVLALTSPSFNLLLRNQGRNAASGMVLRKNTGFFSFLHFSRQPFKGTGGLQNLNIELRVCESVISVSGGFLELRLASPMQISEVAKEDWLSHY